MQGTSAKDTCNTICGDDIQMPGEECDDGNNKSLDGCSEICKKETGFNCKDGNVTAPSQCQEVCGDGVNMGFLACDDGNLLDEDGCSAKCEEEIFWHCYGGSPTAPDTCINTVKTQRLASCQDFAARFSNTCENL